MLWVLLLWFLCMFPTGVTDFSNNTNNKEGEPMPFCCCALFFVSFGIRGPSLPNDVANGRVNSTDKRDEK